MPVDANKTVADVLETLSLDHNDTFYSEERSKAGKEVQLICVWHQKFHSDFFNYFSSCVSAEPIKDASEEEEDGVVRLADCLKAFKQSEILDEDNMWYCNKCKEHVQATKTLELFRVPRVMIISLKRFKQSKNSRWAGMGFGGQKLDTLVDFPLEGLDMSPFVLSKKQKQERPLIYDCFAVSNHMGGVGGGHYTAYGQNPLDKNWYSFNDSSCSSVGSRGGRIVSESAYNLFYRLRDHVDLNNIDYESLKQTADPAFVEELREHDERKAAAKKK